MLIWMLLLVVGLILAIEAPGLIRKKRWRELFAFGLFLTIGTALSIIELLDISWTNPTTMTQAVFQPVARIIHQLLEVK